MWLDRYFRMSIRALLIDDLVFGKSDNNHPFCSMGDETY